MVVSGDKTKLMVTGTHANRFYNLNETPMSLNVDGHEVTETASEKLLGIVVNQLGTWKNHLHGDDENLGLLKELSKRIGILKKLRKYLPAARFKMLVNGIWNSKLQYGISVWGSVWGSNGKLLGLDQNSINIKKNDMKSADDVSSFRPFNKGGAGGGAKGGFKGGKKLGKGSNSRPGKGKRDKMKNKHKK